jgi:hypothetical protein
MWELAQITLNGFVKALSGNVVECCKIGIEDYALVSEREDTRGDNIDRKRRRYA